MISIADLGVNCGDVGRRDFYCWSFVEFRNLQVEERDGFGGGMLYGGLADHNFTKLT